MIKEAMLYEKLTMGRFAAIYARTDARLSPANGAFAG